MAKLFLWAFSALFLISAVIQFNDPDPVYWFAVYLGAAAVGSGAALGRVSRLWTGIVIGACIAGMLLSLPGFMEWLRSGKFSDAFASMAAASYVEPAREFIGLSIALVFCLYCLVCRSPLKRKYGDRLN